MPSTFVHRPAGAVCTQGRGGRAFKCLYNDTDWDITAGVASARRTASTPRASDVKRGASARAFRNMCRVTGVEYTPVCESDFALGIRNGRMGLGSGGLCGAVWGHIARAVRGDAGGTTPRVFIVTCP